MISIRLKEEFLLKKFKLFFHRQINIKLTKKVFSLLNDIKGIFAYYFLTAIILARFFF